MNSGRSQEGVRTRQPNVNLSLNKVWINPRTLQCTPLTVSGFSLWVSGDSGDDFGQMIGFTSFDVSPSFALLPCSPHPGAKN